MSNRLYERCPWCPNSEGCDNCSFSGEPPGNYVLISETEHHRRVRVVHRRWLYITAALLGIIVALSSLFLLFFLGMV